MPGRFTIEEDTPQRGRFTLEEPTAPDSLTTLTELLPDGREVPAVNPMRQRQPMAVDIPQAQPMASHVPGEVVAPRRSPLTRAALAISQSSAADVAGVAGSLVTTPLRMIGEGFRAMGAVAGTMAGGGNLDVALRAGTEPLQEDATGYKPTTRAGKAVETAVATPFQWWSQAGEWVVGDSGNPNVDAAKRVAWESIPFLFGGEKSSFVDSVQKTDWWRMANIEERGLVLQSVKDAYDGMKSQGVSEADIANKGPQYFEGAVRRRMATEDTTDARVRGEEQPPPAAAPVEPEPQLPARRPAPVDEQGGTGSGVEGTGREAPSRWVIEEELKAGDKKPRKRGKKAPTEEPTVETKQPDSLRPAIREGNDVIVGEQGSTHPDLIESFNIGPDHERGFVGPDGEFLTRADAKQWMKEKRPDLYEAWAQEASDGEHSEVHSQELNKAQEVVDGKGEKVSQAGREGATDKGENAAIRVPDKTDIDRRSKGDVPRQDGRVPESEALNEDQGKVPAESKGEAAEPAADVPAEVPGELPERAVGDVALKQPDRRKDLATRKRIAEMSPEEMRQELMTSHKTGIPNQRAYEERERLGHHAAIDADSLKWINDNMGHENGDALIKAVGRAIADETDSGYHFSGDEFVIEGKDQAAVDAVMKRINDRLKNAELVAKTPDGRTLRLKGVGVSHGTGQTLAEADEALNRSKQDREASGERAARGNEPPGVVREPAEGNQAEGGAAEKITIPAVTIEQAGHSLRASGFSEKEVADVQDYLREVVRYGEEHVLKSGKAPDYDNAVFGKADLQEAIDAVVRRDAQDEKPATLEVPSPKNYRIPESPKAPPTDITTLTAHDDITKRLSSGDITPEDLKAAFKSVMENKTVLTAELGKLTKDQLLKRMGGWSAARWKGEKKDRIVEAVYHDMLTDFIISGDGGLSYGMGEGSFERAVTKRVEATTADDITAYAEKVKAAREARKERIESLAKAIKDPETLEEFRDYIRAQRDSGKTLKDARLSLPSDKQAQYDSMAASESRKNRKDRKTAQRTEVRVADQTTEGQVIETKHTKTGEPLFVVKAADRVEREIYNQWNATAKKLGGWYSSFRGAGAVPGFQFKTRENADAFLKFLGGDATEAQDKVKERRNAFEDDRTQTAVERLAEMADSLEERATEHRDRDRKTNTARRARMAAGAEAEAERNIALARTMRNIAENIESGTAQFLDQVRTKAQVEMLEGMAKSAHDETARESTDSWLDYEQERAKPFSKADIDTVDYPVYTAYRSDLARLGREMEEIDGTKKLGAQLTKIADDVTTAYQKFAKENLHKVSTFSTKDGNRPVFPTRDAAMAAIARSGYKGKATTISFKKGEHLIIMGPEMAKEAGLWEGDNDKRLTLPIDLGEAIVAKNKTLGKRNRMTVPWTFDATAEKRTRLASMGIETGPELRSALREFIDAREAPKPPDKVKELERAMVGRKNDGLDFFPTPPGTAQEMIDTADIQDGMRVLEPSAGMGHIADQIREAAGVEPDVVEMSGDRRELLEAKGYNLVGRDFMDIDGQYDRIIMNPPFSNRRDVEHVKHAYDLLRPGGRIVALMGEGTFFGQDKKAVEFRAWRDEVGGTSEKLPPGTFQDPSLPVSTGVNGRMVVIDKPGEWEPEATSVPTEKTETESKIETESVLTEEAKPEEPWNMTEAERKKEEPGTDDPYGVVELPARPIDSPQPLLDPPAQIVPSPSYPEGAELKTVAYKITKKGRKWFEAIGTKGGKAQIEINDYSRHFEVGKEYSFPSGVKVESSKYGTTVKVFPVDAETVKTALADKAKSETEKKNLSELNRWLRYVEDKAPDGYLYEKGVSTLRALGVENHPELRARLDAAITTAKTAGLNRTVRDYLGYIKSNLDKYWYRNGEVKVNDALASLEKMGADTSKSRQALESLRAEFDKKTQLKESSGYEGETYKVGGGSGYGYTEYRVGDVVKNDPRRVEKGQPAFLYVLSSKKSYVREEGMSFGVGDESGYIYSAVTRAATEAESSPLRDRIAKSVAKKGAQKELEQIARNIQEEGEYPKGQNPWPEGEKIADTFNIYGSGDAFVIGQEHIWYLKNNGMDGDNWSYNNVRTGGAGAIGYRIPFSQELADRIRQTNKTASQTLDMLGLQQVYEAIANSRAVKEALPHLETIARQAFREGKTKFEEFRQWMKQTLGDLWDRFKGMMEQVWDRLKSERGSFSTKDLPEAERRFNEYLDQSDKAAELGDEDAAMQWLMKALDLDRMGRDPDKLYRPFTEPDPIPVVDVSNMTSLKNAVTEQEGGQQDRRPFTRPELVQMGKDYLDNNPNINMRDRAREINRYPTRPISLEEHSALLYDKQRMLNELADLDKTSTEAKAKGDQAAFAQAQLDEARISDDLMENYQATVHAGTWNFSAAGHLRQAYMDENYNAVWLHTRARIITGNANLPESLRKRLDAGAARIEELEKQLAATEEREREARAQRAVQRIRNEQDATRGTRRRQQKARTKEERETEYQELSQRLRVVLSPYKLSMNLDPEAVSILKEMAKLRVMDGITKAREIVDDIYDELKSDYAIDRRDIQDAISGYGKVYELSKDDIDVEMREINRQLKLYSALEDAEQGVAPAKSGMEHDPVSDEVRNLRAQVRQAMKQSGIDSRHADPEHQWKTSLDAVKTRLQNQIADLNRQIETGKRDPTKKTGVQYDEEALALKEHRDALRSVLDEIDAKPGMSEERKVEQALNSLDRRIEEYKRRIQTRDLGPKEKKPGADSPEIRRRQAVLDQLKQVYEQMKKDARPPKEPKTQEEKDAIMNRAYRTRLQKRKADLEEMMRTGDFSKSARRTLPLESETERLKAEVQTEKDKVEAAMANLKRQNRTPAEKAADRLIMLQRAMILSGAKVLWKITATGAVTREPIATVREGMGSLLRLMPFIKDIDAKAPREGGGLSVRAEAARYGTYFTKHLYQQMWKKLTRGKNDIEIVYGKKTNPYMLDNWGDTAEEHVSYVLQFPGRMHGALKNLAYVPEFNASVQKRFEHGIRDGQDISDPVWQFGVKVAAERDAQGAQFMQDNALVGAVKQFTSSLRRKGDLGSLGLWTGVKLLTPVMKIPTNIVSEQLSYIPVIGHLRAAAPVIDSLMKAKKVKEAQQEAGKTLWKMAVEQMTPEEADYFMKHLKMATLGTLVLTAIGWYLADHFGGVHIKGKHGEKLKPEEIKLFDTVMSPLWFHEPAIMYMQDVATLRQLMDLKNGVEDRKAERARKKGQDYEKEEAGALYGGTQVGRAMLEQLPFVGQPLRAADAMKSSDSARDYAGYLLSSILVGQPLKEGAKYQDTYGEGVTVPRRTSSIGDVLKSGIPGMRQDLKVDLKKAGRMDLKDLAVLMENAPSDVTEQIKPVFRSKFRRAHGLDQDERDRYLEILKEN